MERIDKYEKNDKKEKKEKKSNSDDESLNKNKEHRKSVYEDIDKSFEEEREELLKLERKNDTVTRSTQNKICIELKNNVKVYLNCCKSWNIQKLISHVTQTKEFKKLYHKKDFVLFSNIFSVHFDLDLTLFKKVMADEERNIDKNITLKDLFNLGFLKNTYSPFLTLSDNILKSPLELEKNKDLLEYKEIMLAYSSKLPRINSMYFIKNFPELVEYSSIVKSYVSKLAKMKLNTLISDNKDWFDYNEESLEFLIRMDKLNIDLDEEIYKFDIRGNLFIQDLLPHIILPTSEYKYFLLKIRVNSEIEIKLEQKLDSTLSNILDDVKKKLNKFKNLDIDINKIKTDKILKAHILNDYIIDLDIPLGRFQNIHQCLINGITPDYHIIDRIELFTKSEILNDKVDSKFETHQRKGTKTNNDKINFIKKTSIMLDANDFSKKLNEAIKENEKEKNNNSEIESNSLLNNVNNMASVVKSNKIAEMTKIFNKTNDDTKAKTLTFKKIVISQNKNDYLEKYINDIEEMYYAKLENKKKFINKNNKDSKLGIEFATKITNDEEINKSNNTTNNINTDKNILKNISQNKVLREENKINEDINTNINRTMQINQNSSILEKMKIFENNNLSKKMSSNNISYDKDLINNLKNEQIKDSSNIKQKNNNEIQLNNDKKKEKECENPKGKPNLKINIDNDEIGYSGFQTSKNKPNNHVLMDSLKEKFKQVTNNNQKLNEQNQLNEHLKQNDIENNITNEKVLKPSDFLSKLSIFEKNTKKEDIIKDKKIETLDEEISKNNTKYTSNTKYTNHSTLCTNKQHSDTINTRDDYSVISDLNYKTKENILSENVCEKENPKDNENSNVLNKLKLFDSNLKVDSKSNFNQRLTTNFTSSGNSVSEIFEKMKITNDKNFKNKILNNIKDEEYTNYMNTSSISQRINSYLCLYNSPINIHTLNFPFKFKLMSIVKISSIKNFNLKQYFGDTYESQKNIDLELSFKIMLGKHRLSKEIKINILNWNKKSFEQDEMTKNLNLDILFQDINFSQLPLYSSLFVKINICHKNQKKNETSNINTISWVNFKLFDYKKYLNSGKYKLNLHNEFSGSPGDFSNYNWSNKQNAVSPSIFEAYIEIPEFSGPVENDLTKCYKNIIKEENDSSKDNIIDRISKLNPFEDMNEEEKRVLWNNRNIILENPKLIPRLIQSLNFKNPEDLKELIKILDNAPLIDPIESLQLLTGDVLYEEIRNYAVKCLKKLDVYRLEDYLIQLIQALKYEPNHFSRLSEHLLNLSIKYPATFGHTLFWALKSEMVNQTISQRYGLMLEIFLSKVGKIFYKYLEEEIWFVNRLLEIADIPFDKRFKDKSKKDLMLENYKITLKVLDTDIKQVLINKNDNFKTKRIPLPTNFKMLVVGINYNKCRIMKSKKRPMWITLDIDNYPFKSETESIMFKKGDDLRQDILTLQLFKIMKTIWFENGINLKMSLYPVVSTGYFQGMLGMVKNSETLATIHSKHGGAMAAFSREPLKKWLENNVSLGESEYINNFKLSCAAYCIATFVLGIGDRHNDNIMIKNNGEIFHIDFGHFLGHFKYKYGIKRERAPFVFTREFKKVLGGKKNNQ